LGNYDAIILGAGHNGLILQAYLGKAGLRTVCLERRASAGGGLTTVEMPAGSGFRHNTHSFFHRGLTHLPWFRDLELADVVKYLEPELNVALITPGGDVLEWWTDPEKTEASFAQFSARDAARLRHWIQTFEPINEHILIPESTSPPLPPEQRRALLSATREGQLLLALSELSPLEFVRREFEHPVIQAGLLFFNGLREVDLNCRGLGHHIPSLLASGRMAQLCVGGSQRLAEALGRVIGANGGEIRLETVPQRIRVDGGRVSGVITDQGEVFEAPLVISSLNPHQTFLGLLEPGTLPSTWREQAGQFKYNEVAPLFSVNVNLRAAPDYAAAGNHPELARAFMVILGLDTPEQFEMIVRHHRAGTIPPDRVMWGACPTIFDPGQAPPGAHTAFMWEKLPYRLHGEATQWDSMKAQHTSNMLEDWNRYAPGLADTVTGIFIGTPLDIERTFPNMAGGDLLIGSFERGQIGFNRPFPGAGHYRTPIKGLYLCGSCCHPGGNITGLPGYNSAQIVLADLEIQAPWRPRPIEQTLTRNT
jgi:phytoene dehydrogenase-like protein